MDSDGDGLTNGFELGDPCGVWKEGATPAYTTDISHPGNATSKPVSRTAQCAVNPCTSADASVREQMARIIAMRPESVALSQQHLRGTN